MTTLTKMMSPWSLVDHVSQGASYGFCGTNNSIRAVYLSKKLARVKQSILSVSRNSNGTLSVFIVFALGSSEFISSLQRWVRSCIRWAFPEQATITT